MSELPSVSVVGTVLNEERHLRAAVASVLQQDYPGAVEVVLALGPSSDRTADIAAELAKDPRVSVVPNPSGRTPAGLNKAIAASRYPVVARMDGHAELPRDYLRIAVELLERTDADNVGGLMWAEGTTEFERAVARAMTSRIGVGHAPFHVGGEEGPADTVYLGVFRRAALERVGGYDEVFTRAQDWEMNYRLRSTGGLVWFTPKLRVAYRPRGSLGQLATQYYYYGRWRNEVMRRHPSSVSLRYLAPPLALVGVAAGLAVGLVGTVAGIGPLEWAFALPGGYAAFVLAGAVVTGRGLPVRSKLLLPAVFATMHGSWGYGFLSSLMSRRRRSGR